ncbi:CBS domain-containing protein [Streptomyces sp. NPDC015139]|uniref:CBS domain-containing protein n=1 Tax=Streptomyces sp. NPDC015139 TaxID=3364942 RepID=UPI0036F90A1C
MYSTSRTVGDVMTHPVASVGRWASFKDMAETMQHRRISALPVLEGAGRVIGIVSEADLLPTEELRDSPDRGYALRRAADITKAGALTAGELMTSPAITIRAGATLAAAARIMARQHLKHLPVVDETGLLQGVISRSDLLRAFLRPDSDIAAEIRRDIVPHLLPVTSSPLQVDVHDGVVDLTGCIRDDALIPVVSRLVGAVEGVVNVHLDLNESAGRHQL